MALQTPFRSLAGTEVLPSTLQHVTGMFWQLWRLARGSLQPRQPKIWSFMATSDACSPVGHCKRDCVNQGLNSPSGNLTVGNLQGWLTASTRGSYKHLHLLCGESLLFIECCQQDQRCAELGGRQGARLKYLTNALLLKTTALGFYETLTANPSLPEIMRRDGENKNIPYRSGCVSRD